MSCTQGIHFIYIIYIYIYSLSFIAKLLAQCPAFKPDVSAPLVFGSMLVWISAPWPFTVLENYNKLTLNPLTTEAFLKGILSIKLVRLLHC